MMNVWMRYWQTVRHLKAVQLYGRVTFRLSRPTPDLRPAPPLRAVTGRWTPPVVREPALLDHARLRLLNRDVAIRSADDWAHADLPRLLVYNLHYFDDLASHATAERQSWQATLIARWIAENPPGDGPGWEPYPTSLRLVNWFKWSRSGAVPPHGFLQSAVVQARWLTRRIEYHLQANHLFVNAKALFIASIWFDGPEADAWRATALRIIAEQLPEQIHADGGHFEASPMYHALMLEDVLDLINSTALAPHLVEFETMAQWRATAARMDSWLRALSHPDGDIAFFNDAAIGVAPRSAALRAYADALGIASIPAVLSDSGYVRAERGRAVLLADIAPVGPDYQPGHAHADTLSFELSLGDARLIVNSGTSTYDAGPQRAFERSTAAHSTVCINSRDSSEVWGGFRVARRARARMLARQDSDEKFCVAASHDGYRTQPGHPTHERRWCLTADGLVVTDRCSGAHRAVARYYLHPAVTPLPDGRLTLADGTTVHWQVQGGQAQVVPARWFPSFNTEIVTHCIEIEIDGIECQVSFAW